MLSQEIFWILTPSSPLSWVSESFRWDIGQFNSPRIKHLSNPFSRFQPGKFFLLKIYLLWKIWPISVKRWKPVWVRAWFLMIDLIFHWFLAQRNDFYYPSSTIKSLPCPSQNRFAFLYCISILVPLRTALHVLPPVQFQLGASVCNHTRDLSKTRA